MINKIQQGNKIQMISCGKIARTFIVLDLEDIKKADAINARLFDVDEKTEQWWTIKNHLNIEWKITEENQLRS